MNKLFVLSLSALLTGCFKIGPDYIRPQVDIPRQWRFAESNVNQNATNLKWWEQLGDPVLNRLVSQATQGNLDMKIAVAKVEQFMGQYGSTRANLFPQIFGAGNYVHDQPSSAGGDVLNSGTNDDEVDFARLGASMNWELDVWGRLRRANEAARADLLRQEAIKHAVILTLVSQVAQTYMTLRELDKNLEITKNIVKSLEEEQRVVKIRFDEGYASKLELKQIDSEYQRRSAFIHFYEQQIALTENALSVLLGLNPGPIPRGLTLDELKIPSVPAGLPSDLLVQRPDIQQAEQELIAANARIGLARAQYFPKFSLR